VVTLSPEELALQTEINQQITETNQQLTETLERVALEQAEVARETSRNLGQTIREVIVGFVVVVLSVIAAMYRLLPPEIGRGFLTQMRQWGEQLERLAVQSKTFGTIDDAAVKYGNTRLRGLIDELDTLDDDELDRVKADVRSLRVGKSLGGMGDFNPAPGGP
jgi:hypothetical protein